MKKGGEGGLCEGKKKISTNFEKLGIFIQVELL